MDWRRTPAPNPRERRRSEVIDAQLRLDYSASLRCVDVLLLACDDDLRVEAFEALTGTAPPVVAVASAADAEEAEEDRGRARDAVVTVGTFAVNVITFSLRRSVRAIRRLEIFDQASVIFYLTDGTASGEAAALLARVRAAFPNGAPAIHALESSGGATSLAAAAKRTLQALQEGIATSVAARVADYDPRSEVLHVRGEATAPRVLEPPPRLASLLALAASLAAIGLVAWHRRDAP